MGIELLKLNLSFRGLSDEENPDDMGLDDNDAEEEDLDGDEDDDDADTDGTADLDPVE